MDQSFPGSRRPGILLFDEDFDEPAIVEPETIEPVFSAADLAAARRQAADDARAQALTAAETSARQSVSQALAAIAGQLEAARVEARSLAEQNAESIARLLLGCFAAAFPGLTARHGPAEVTALLREILPALQREPKVTVRVNPHCAAALSAEIRSLDADLGARVRLVPTDALGPGDVRVTWEHGAAVRDTASLWNQIEEILSPAGLLDTAESPPAKQSTKEHELVE